MRTKRKRLPNQALSRSYDTHREDSDATLEEEIKGGGEEAFPLFQPCSLIYFFSSGSRCNP
jgi:hypothetical protein